MPTPHVEVVRGRMTVRANNQPDAAGERQGYHWFLALTSYVTSPVGVAVVLPEHRCQGQITFEGFDLTMDTTPKLSPTGRSDGRLIGSGRSEPVEASLIQRGDAQVVVMGPGFLSLTAHIYQSFPGPPPNLALLDSANVRMALRPAGSDRSIAMGVALDRVSTQLNPPRGWAERSAQCTSRGSTHALERSRDVRGVSVDCRPDGNRLQGARWVRHQLRVVCMSGRSRCRSSR